LYHRETDPDLRSLALDEAANTFSFNLPVASSCLMALGQAMVADERGDARKLHDALKRSLATVPDDPQLPIAHEWLLGRLHGLELSDRLVVAELLPLGIEHCLSGWGRHLVLDLVRKARQSWETPSFLTGRSRLRESDPSSRFDAVLLFSFWTGRGEEIRRQALTLADQGELRPHHLSDAYFALVELGETEDAGALLNEVLDAGMATSGPDGARERTPPDDFGERWQPHVSCCRASEAALAGALEEAEELLYPDRSKSGDPLFRPFNSARLILARAAWADSKKGLTRRALRLQGKRDTFAQEHQAWFALLDGDTRHAERNLRSFVERGHHLSGRNLSNFLYGALQISCGDDTGARRTFEALPDAQWPRTWTLGSYLASGRLGGGEIEAYLARAFPWERRVLASHRELLEAVGAKS
jgi:hypothetical protein